MTMVEPERAGKVRVPSADDMDLDIFCLHMTARHADSLGGLSRLEPERLNEYVEECYRIFHDKLHGEPLLFHHEFDHEHRKPR